MRRRTTVRENGRGKKRREEEGGRRKKDGDGVGVPSLRGGRERRKWKWETEGGLVPFGRFSFWE